MHKNEIDLVVKGGSSFVLKEAEQKSAAHVEAFFAQLARQTAEAQKKPQTT